MVIICRHCRAYHVVLDLGISTRKKENKERACPSSVPQSRSTATSHIIFESNNQLVPVEQ